METMNVKRILFLVFFLALFVLVARLFYPFLTVMLWSGLIYILLLPLYEKLTGLSRSKNERPMSHRFLAGLFALLGVVLLVLPLVLLSINLAKQVGELTSASIRFLEHHPEYFDLSPNGTVGGFIHRVTDGALDLSGIDVRGELYRFIASSGQRVIGISGAFIRNAATFVLALAFMVFTLYFFFMDGRHLAKVLVGAIPIEREYTRLFIRTLRVTSKQLVVGYVLVALYQAVAAFAIFSLFHVKGPLVLASLTMVAAFVPMLGAGLIWLPVAGVRIASGDIVGGVILLVVSAVMISGMDNFIRPVLLKQRLNLHPLVIFFSILGGLQLFGFNGLILGPLIIILFFTALGLYDNSYRQMEPEEQAAPPMDEGGEGKEAKSD